MSDISTAIREGLAVSRKYSSWTSPKGFAKDGVPFRLWEKAKALHWDPSDIDFSQDRSDWRLLDEDQQMAVAGLAAGFMVGEEGVTLDILPLVDAMSAEHRLEDVMFLTTFAYEEAKHVDFFRKWFDAIDTDLEALQARNLERLVAQGIKPPDPDRSVGMFESELPRVMQRLRTDRSAEAILDACVTYNQFVEGCLALSGYKVWAQIFETFGVMPGLQKGLSLVRVDESRHITYGTYLARRTIAENPHLMDWARDRMYALRDFYFEEAFGDTVDMPQIEEPDAAALLLGPDGPFASSVIDQVERRIHIMERAVAMSESDAELGVGSEEAEAEAEQAPALVGGA